MTSASDRITLVSSAIWVVLVGVLCTDAGIGIFSLFVLLLGGAALVALWCIRLAFHLLRGRGRGRSLSWRRVLLEPLFVAVVALLVLSGVVFQVRFQASRPFLERYVRSVEADNVSANGRAAPTVVGLFVVREVERRPGGVVRMITTTCSFDDCGLAYSPTGAPPVVGEDSYRSLGGGWWKWWRSW